MQEGHPIHILGDEERIKGPSSTPIKKAKSRVSISHGGESPSFQEHCNTNLDQHRGHSLSLAPCVHHPAEHRALSNRGEQKSLTAVGIGEGRLLKGPKTRSYCLTSFRFLSKGFPPGKEF